MHVYVYVYTYICIYIYVHMYISVCLHRHIDEDIYAYKDTYIVHLYIYMHRKTYIMHLYIDICMYTHLYACHGCDENGKFCGAYSGNRTYISGILGQCTTITPCNRLPDITTTPMSTCLCSSLPQRSVATTTMYISLGLNFA